MEENENIARRQAAFIISAALVKQIIDEHGLLDLQDISVIGAGGAGGNHGFSVVSSGPVPSARYLTNQNKKTKVEKHLDYIIWVADWLLYEEGNNEETTS